MQRKNWTDESRALLMTLADEGYPQEEIAKILKRSVNAVRNEIFRMRQHEKNSQPLDFCSIVINEQGIGQIG